jgi:hypothetical protein
LNENTGKITIAATTPAQYEGIYVIVATPTNANYDGTKRSTVKIAIPHKSIVGNQLTYGTTSIAYGVGKIISPENNFPGAAGVKFVIKAGILY